jgi:signal peptidase II
MKKIFIKYALFFLVLLVGLGADFFSKERARHTLDNKPPVSAIQGFLDLGFIENRGMVFGILNRESHAHAFISFVTWVRVAVCIGVSVFIVMKRQMPFFFLLPFLFIWMGAIGNLIDSFRLGYVVDFIHIHAGKTLDWPFFFNVADAYVCIGAGMLIVTGYFFPEKCMTSSEEPRSKLRGIFHP